MNSGTIIETLVLNTLINRDPAPELFPATAWRPALRSEIDSLPTGMVARIGLHIWNDDLDHAHGLLQDREDKASQLWHAVTHRRQGELDNASYWYKKAGAHTDLKLAHYYQRLADFDPKKLAENTMAYRSLQRIQTKEMIQLLSFSLEQLHPVPLCHSILEHRQAI